MYLTQFCVGQKVKRNCKKPLDESESGEWKNWLKAQHSETKIMSSGPITSWEIDGETVETVADFILGGSKITVPHSSTLAWKIPWMEEPGRLPSMGSLRVGHNWATSLLLFTFMHWRRKWQPTPMFLPWESQGWGSLVDCHLWGRTESDMTEVT